MIYLDGGDNFSEKCWNQLFNKDSDDDQHFLQDDLRGFSSLEGWQNRIFFYFIFSKYNISKMCGRKDLPWL